MLDRNGREIKAGDIVKVSGAYFKKDNGGEVWSDDQNGFVEFIYRR